jgi:hypothetical protein
MGGACSTYGFGFLWGKQKERDQWGDPGVDGRIIFMKWELGGTDWIELVQDRDRWRAISGSIKRGDKKRTKVQQMYGNQAFHTFPSTNGAAARL